MVEVKYSTVYF